jgi:C4-dicarboxylate-specific signal transduction histidine kinase
LPGVEIELELNRNIPELEIQRSDLYHIIYNLITNSIEALEKSRAGRIRTTTDMQNGDILIKILDNGEGIAQEISINIFDPYFSTHRI